MSGLRIDLRSECPECKGPLTINALVSELACARCGKPFKVDAETWKTIFGGTLLSLVDAEVGQQKQRKVTHRGRPFLLTVTRSEPECSECGTEVPFTDAVEHAPRGWVACVGCGTRLSLRIQPFGPRSVALPGVTHLVGEDADDLEGLGLPDAPARTRERVPRHWYFWYDAGALPVMAPSLWDTKERVLADAAGRRLAEVVAVHLAGDFKRDTGIDVLDDRSVMRKLREAAARALIDLLTDGKAETQVRVRFLGADEGGPRHLDVKLPKAALKKMVTRFKGKPLRRAG